MGSNYFIKFILFWKVEILQYIQTCVFCECFRTITKTMQILTTLCEIFVLFLCNILFLKISLTNTEEKINHKLVNIEGMIDLIGHNMWNNLKYFFCENNRIDFMFFFIFEDFLW